MSLFGGKAVRNLIWMLFLVLLANPAACFTCLNHQVVEDEKYCRFFLEIPKDSPRGQLDRRLLDRIPSTGGNPSTPIKNIALIVDVNKYPNLPPPDNDLAPARLDLTHLKKFLVEQEFDEIIVLENNEATRDNIDYFIEKYIVDQTTIYGVRSRVLFAFSGHGKKADNINESNALALSKYGDGDDYDGLYDLNDLLPKFKKVASKTFQFVALLGSCYSGGIFSVVSNGENNVFPRARGAHALTAVKADELAYATSPDSGSIFFNYLIEGVETGDGDRDYGTYVRLPNGDLHNVGGGIVRLGALEAYISKRIEDLQKNPNTGLPYPQLRIGSIFSGDEWGGAFFFLGPPAKEVKETVVNQAPSVLGPLGDIRQKVSVAFDVPSQSIGSSLAGRSDFPVFRAPDSYRVFGVDVSHYNGAIGWKSLREQGISFAYMKATEGDIYSDKTFGDNWKGAAENDVIPGGYHVFNFCVASAAQIKNIKASKYLMVGKSLPFAIDVEWYDGKPFAANQKACNDVAKIRTQIKEMISALNSTFGKPPSLHVTADGVRDLLNSAQLGDYSIWLQDFKKAPKFRDDKSYNDDGPQLPGSKPWTIWQYTSRAALRGITGNVDLDAFFGSKENFQEFVGTGKSNLLDAERKSVIVCTGEFENSCPGPHDRFVSCPNLPPEQLLRQICSRPQGSTVVLRTVTEGNNCGYSLQAITCN